MAFKVKLDSKKKKYYDELIAEGDGEKIQKRQYEKLAPYMIEAQIINGYIGVNETAKLYAKYIDDDSRLTFLRALVQDIMKASAYINGADGVLKRFRTFTSNVKFPDKAKVDDIIAEKNSYLKQKTDMGPENLWTEIANFPQTIYYKLINFVEKRTAGTSGPKPGIETYKQIYEDVVKIYRTQTKTARNFMGQLMNWSDAEKLASKEVELEGDTYETTGIRAPTPYRDEDEIPDDVSVRTGGPPGRDEEPESDVAYASRAPKFKGEFEPGTEELIYAMGDFWTRVKETGGGSLLAVQILQAAADKLGRPEGLDQLFKIAASKLDEELPQ